MRRIIERIFSTFTDRAMPYIPARTYSNPQERGDYNTEARVTLTDEQLASIFIRYIVDVYHQSLHFGLYEETPQNAYNRLVGTIGKPPELPKHIHRRAFGIRVERVLTRKGIRVLGIDFHSQELVDVRKQHGSLKCPIYVDPDSLGVVSIYVKGDWIEVPNSIEDFRGISVAEWNAVGEILRRRYAAEARVNFAEILAALEYARARMTEAQKIVGTLPQAPTAEEFDRLENNLWHGLSVFGDKPSELPGLMRSSDGLGYVIGEPAKDGPSSDLDHESISPLDDFAPEIEPPITDDRNVDDDGWWQLENDDDD